MSISPINFNGMIQNTNEVSHTKATEDQKPQMQQDSLTLSVDRQKEQEAKQVNDLYKAENKEERYDREGNGKGYQGNNKKRSSKGKKDEKISDGSVKEKHISSFDMRI